MRPVELEVAGHPSTLAELELPLEPSRLLPGGPWEVELGFGKGRYLLRRAAQEPGSRFLGIEVSRYYWRLFCRRVRRRGLLNVVAFRGEALYLLCAVLARGFARAVHVYFPDPWPKSRHHKRRLFDPETVDLVLRLLRPCGTLYFATDHMEYGESVVEILACHPALEVRRRRDPWPEGARTNYEAKFMEEGRPILRLEAVLSGAEDAPLLHPAGIGGLVVGTADPSRSAL